MPKHHYIPERMIIEPPREWWTCIGGLHQHQTLATAEECEARKVVRKRGTVRTLADDGHYYLSGYDRSGRFEGRHAYFCCEEDNDVGG